MIKRDHVFFDSQRVAAAIMLADAVDSYNMTTPAAYRVAEDEVEALYEAKMRGNNVREALQQLIQVVSGAQVRQDHVFYKDIDTALALSRNYL